MMPPLAIDGAELRQGLSADEGEAAVVRRCLITALFASIFLQRFALPVGEDGVAINLLVTVFALLVMAVRGALTLDPVRTVLFFLLAAAASLSTAINAGMASVPSLALFLLIYAPYILSLRNSEGVFDACVRAFQVMVLICALLGILQFFTQFVIGNPIPFTFKGIVPDWLLLPGFHTANPLSWNSPYFKSNGFFLVEPSTFSQYLAMAVILELLFFGVTWRLLVFGLALPTSYSGTGLVLLLFILPWLMLYLRAYGAVVGALVLVVLAVLTGSLWNLDALLNRVNEFGSQGSSANARFIAGAWVVGEFLLDSARDVIFGFGPGSYPQYVKLVPYEAHDPAWVKMIFEYGLLGSAVFWPFFLIALFRGSPSRWVTWSVLIGYLTFGGMLLDPRLHVWILIFCVLPKRPAPAAVQARDDWTSPLMRPVS
ncbi:hypothetical protein QMO56_06550 [Roseomonas sp. E05]|uniref:hypothetical protein n=1 Tax=Roseomonas sp. E05 TaxID=3046310 RepID=UPI0024B94735|nr:hypothetical protein [Roseomonas sp. E05]MDJ0387767.1 hypothetical protein [Roseomonas sp. E05]